MRVGAGEFHFEVPSLRSILAWLLFRAIDLFTALIIAAVIVTVMAMPVIAIAWLLKMVLQILMVCTS